MPARLPILVLLLVLLGTACQRKTSESGTRANRPVPTSVNAPGKVTTRSRPVHPHSIVPGGVSTPEEMATAVKEDDVVREHYIGLRPASFKVETLPADRQGYVSYRIRDKVFWTKRPMTLKKGEVVLTDGATMIRGRCGNRVSGVPMEPVAVEEDEPEEVVLDSFRDERLLAGIPPVPEASPLDDKLVFTRYPEVAKADSLLVPPGSSFGLIVEPANISSFGVVLGASGGGGGVGGGGGGGGFGGGAPGGGGVTFGPPNTAIPFTTAPPSPYLITYVPPALTPFFPPTGPYGAPQPYVPERPNLPPTTIGQPPGSTPPSYPQPPTVPPASPPFTPPGTPTGPPSTVPPETPPETPPGPPRIVPPGSDSPPPFTPPSVQDPPPPQDTSVPEPSTFLLVAGALAAYGASRYFAKR